MDHCIPGGTNRFETVSEPGDQCTPGANFPEVITPVLLQRGFSAAAASLCTFLAECLHRTPPAAAEGTMGADAGCSCSALVLIPSCSITSVMASSPERQPRLSATALPPIAG